MKILIFGAGVAGTTFAWVFEQAGHDVTLLVRPGHEDRWNRGINLRILDARGGGRKDVKMVYHPHVVTSFVPDDGYDIVIETVRYTQTEEALPQLVANLGDATLLFFNNNWQGLDVIDGVIAKNRYVLGMHHVGGVISNGVLDGAIEGNVVLGASIWGEATPASVAAAVRKNLDVVVELFHSANFKVEIQENMEWWYSVHFAGTATWTGAAAKAGGLDHVVHSSRAIHEALVAGREAMEICRAQGVDVSKIGEAKPFLAPAFVMAPIMRRLMTRDLIARVSQTSVDYEPEFRRMYDDLVVTGHRLEVRTPHLDAYRPYVDVEKQPQLTGVQ
jgi:2-dehydropantoate 2-reductase